MRKCNNSRHLCVPQAGDQDAYGGFIRLLEVLLPEGVGWAVMLEAYCDESGTHANADLLCVTACVASPEQWRKFCRQWKGTLVERDIPLFHMKDFKNWSGQARKYLTREECDPFIRRLMGIIRRYVSFSISVSISEKEYREYTSDRFRSQFGGAYALCAQGLFFSIAHRAGQEHSGPVAYFFESGPRGQDHLGKVFQTVATSADLKERFAFDRYVFWPKREAIPLQAADLVAYVVATSRRHPESEEYQRLQKMDHEHAHLGPKEIMSTISEIQDYMAREKQRGKIAAARR